MILSYLSFFTFLSCLTLGILALYLDLKARLNRAFSLISLTSAIWAFGYIFIYIGNDMLMIWFWYRFAVVGGIYLFFATINFLFVFANLKGKIRFVFTVLLAGFFIFLTWLAYIQMTGTLFVVDFVKTPWGNAGIVDTTLPGYYLVNIAAVISIIFGLMILIAGYRYNISRRYRIQMRGLILFTQIPVIFVVLSNFLLPTAKETPVPFVGVIFLNITVVGIFYLITAYRLMRIDFSLLKPEDIVSHIGDMILLLDKDFRIVMVNEAAGDVLSIPRNMLKGLSFSEIISTDEDADLLLENFSGNPEESQNLRLTYRKNEEDSIVTETYISKMKDRFREIIGILVISREIRGRNEFRKAYGISDREMEVLDMILAGKSSRSIAERLRISPRTVETHTVNIYNKLGINKKSDLFRFCSKFNLIPR